MREGVGGCGFPRLLALGLGKIEVILSVKFIRTQAIASFVLFGVLAIDCILYH